MAINIATAYVQIVPSMKNVGKAITSAFGNASESVGNSEGAKLGGGLTDGLSAKFGVVTGIAQNIAGRCIDAFRGLGGEIASASDSAQKFGSTLQFAGVSERQIKKLTASTQKYADVTVYDLNDIRNTTAQLAANGVPHYAELAEAAGNLNAVAGGNADTFKSVAMVMTQTAGAGKLTTENWNQLADAIPGASGKLQEAMRKNGAYTGDFRDAMAKGEITAGEFNQAIMQLGMTDAAKEAATSTSTIEGALGNLEAAAVKAGMTVLDAVKPMVTGAMNAVGDGLTAATAVIQPAVYGAVKWLQDLWAKLEDNGAVTAFKSAWDTVRDAIMGVANMVIDWIRMMPPDSVATAIKLVADALNWFVQHGQALAPIIIGIGAAFAAVKGYQALDNGLAALTKTMDVVAASATGVSNGIAIMMELGGPAQMVEQLAGKMKLAQTAQAAWSAVTKAATAVQGAFNAVIAATGGPIVWIIGLIAAISGAIVYFFTQTETGRRMWSAFVTWLQQAWQSIASFFTGLWNGIVLTFQSAAQTVQSAWSGVTGFFAGLWNAITAGVQAAWNAIANVFTTAGQGIQTAVATVWTVIGALILAPIQLVQNGINAVFGWMLSFITGQMESTSGVMQTVWTGIYNIVNGVWTAIGTVVQTVINYVRTIIVAVLDLIKGDWQGAWNTVSGFFQTTWNAIVSFLAPATEAVKTTIGNALNAISTWWNGVWNGISGFLNGVWNGMVNAVSNNVNAVRSVIAGALDAIRGPWNGVWNGISGFLNGVWNGMVNAVGGAIGRIGGQVGRIYGLVTGALSGAGGWLYDAGRNIVQGLINGIGGAFGWLRRTITNLGSSVVGWAKSVLGIHSPSRVFRDQIGQYIPQGMAAGIDDAMGYASKAMDELGDTLAAHTPDIAFDATGTISTTRTPGITSDWTATSTHDRQTVGTPLTKADMLDCLRIVMSDGVTLHLNSRGGEVMAGKLAKPMAYELEKASALGR